MTVATKSYNPGFLTDDELREMFCVRVLEFESIVETLHENTGPSNQHRLVIGPRGSGKTTLLLRVALEIRSDPELSSRLYPIPFAEESYAVGTCGEFWLECLSRLAQQVPHQAHGLDLGRTVEDVRRERDDRNLRDRCLGALLHFAELEGKRLVLLVENLDMLFSDMKDPYVGWCLRKTLQTEPQIMVVGSATSRFGEIDRPDKALYDFFGTLTLRPLNRNDSAVLCDRVAGMAVAEGVGRRLQILTGGNPRLMSILARFGAARSFGTLLSDLLDVVDEHTAYFKSHLESLPAQERRVYLALAELWKPATAREVAERARMGTSKCSAQLRRLSRRGVVSDAGGSDRRKQYHVIERLYNIYYLLRRSRGTDSMVGALGRFMDAYYSRDRSQMANPDSDGGLASRIAAWETRAGAQVKEGRTAAAAEDVRAVLRTLPKLAAMPARTVRFLLYASAGLGAERMVALIRESPSASVLLPLTTALELDMGQEPRVAQEIREVAEDLRADLGELREGQEDVV